MSSRLLQADYVLSSSCLQVVKSRQTNQHGTEPDGLVEGEGKSGKNENRKGGRKVVGKSRRSFTIFLSTCVPGQVTDWRSRAV